MLSRTADSLYWTGRLMERADYLARILDAATRLSSLPASYGEAGDAWASAVESSGVGDAYRATHAVFDESSVRAFLAFAAAERCAAPDDI